MKIEFKLDYDFIFWHFSGVTGLVAKSWEAPLCSIICSMLEATNMTTSIGKRMEILDGVTMKYVFIACFLES